MTRDLYGVQYMTYMMYMIKVCTQWYKHVHDILALLNMIALVWE
jgi:hypothetical protein